MKENKKIKNKGITLVALVITIIILLILAGIAIASLTGDNRLFARANQARQNTLDAQNKENATLQGYEDAIDQVLGEEIKQVTDTNPGVLEVDEINVNIYIINSIEDLVFFANDVTNGNNYEGKTVKLGLNLDFNSDKSYVEPYRTNYTNYGYDGELKTLLTSGEGFKPIGSIYDSETQNFSGVFDGQGKSINNLYINFNSDEGEEDIKLGLFTRNRGSITNLKLLSVNIIYSRSIDNVTSSIGGICGQSSPGMLENCLVTGNISSSAPRIVIGGITGTHNR